ncbi:tyrosine-type recombinase/integrase [Leptospira weilii]|uniref:tyrosine-type recombinase/integrase n=1 Tax=Leptospira weilii TaxID=28184 RepID=UPI001EF2B6DE|nr:tyrosine-type recombinase/integrase [Leptospira weilii]ULH27633.1 tyrosine-type recombinase/integrase [Leptospira weilii]ULH27642.1 tyrosine-type recombinase/integrase [Leptospira weilii]ULH27651.1 tyrosine-type recombinase/integrase [Leptospira weilii]UPY77343.1 tyrosine-type recombinase/integrase [Leptospira weilii]UPY77352.1 tyrosine-type recombinase/integrase [Leptospira weilii]
MNWQEKLETLRISPLGSFENYCYSYLERNRTGKGHSRSTLENTYWNLMNFFDWCRLREIRHPNEVTLSLLERYRNQVIGLKNKMNGKELSNNNKHKRLTSVREYFGWLARKRVLLVDPSLDLEIPKYVKRNIPHNVLSVEEAEKILSVPDVTTVLGLRDRTMLEVVYSTGIRRMELGNLCLSDIDFQTRTVLVREGKGKKTRVIPISERALSWVRRYLERSRFVLSRNADEPHLFLGKSGRKMEHGSITSLFAVFREAASVKKRQAVHIFRHTTATGMLDNGADIRHVQEMLGHETLSTTQIYTHVAIRKLKEVYDKTHPSLHTPDPSSLVGESSEKEKLEVQDKEESDTS